VPEKDMENAKEAIQRHKKARKAKEAATKAKEAKNWLLLLFFIGFSKTVRTTSDTPV
jgi:hypothetical protein